MVAQRAGMRKGGWCGAPPGRRRTGGRVMTRRVGTRRAMAWRSRAWRSRNRAIPTSSGEKTDLDVGIAQFARTGASRVRIRAGATETEPSWSPGSTQYGGERGVPAGRGPADRFAARGAARALRRGTLTRSLGSAPSRVRIRAGATETEPSWAPARRNMAERGGFEPPGPLRAQRFSRPPHSTALPSLHGNVMIASNPQRTRGRYAGTTG